MKKPTVTNQLGRHAEIVPIDGSHYVLVDGQPWSRHAVSLAQTQTSRVCFSNVPLDINEGAKGGHLLEITLRPDCDISAYELIEEGKPYREWCVPAKIINERMMIRPVVED
jgi:hypothetical protein